MIHFFACLFYTSNALADLLRLCSASYQIHIGTPHSSGASVQQPLWHLIHNWLRVLQLALTSWSL